MIRRLRPQSDKYYMFGFALVGLADSVVVLCTGGCHVTDWRRVYLVEDDELIASYRGAVKVAYLIVFRGRSNLEKIYDSDT